MLLYFFPPTVGPAIQRGLKFCKYMNKFGYEPYVVTVKPAAGEVHDHGLMNDLSEVRHRVYRVPKLDFSGVSYQQRAASYNRAKLQLFVNAKVLVRNLIVPDKAVFWGLLAFRRARRIMRSKNIEVVFTSFFPGTAHWVGLRLKKRFKDIIWVADFRDSWMSDPTVKRRFINRVVNRPLERRVLQTCDYALFVNKSIERKYTRNHPGIVGKTLVVSNGFDQDDLGMLKENPEHPVASKRIIVTHAGTLSQTRTPDALLTAIANYNAGVAHGRMVKFMSIGAFYSDLPERAINAMINDDTLQIVPFVPKRELYSYYAQADIISVIVNQSPGSQEIQTGKLFEAISLQRPVLLLAPIPGEAERIVNETGTGVVVEPFEVDMIEAALHDLVNGKRFKPDRERIAQYSSEKNTEKLCALLDQLREGKRST
jgi:glycosyltransferase involved in cell wall biosynthesis